MIVMSGCLYLGLACQKNHEDDVNKSYFLGKLWLSTV